MRISELADEFGINSRELLTEIRKLHLGIGADNPMSRLTDREVTVIRRAHGIVDHPMLGFWRRRPIVEDADQEINPQSHLVVREDTLWNVVPDTVRHDDDPDWWRPYELDWPPGAEDGHLVVHQPHQDFCAVVRRRDKELHIKWGAVAGEPPTGYLDPAGRLEVFVPETNPDVLADLESPPTSRPRATASHPDLGELTYDDNLSWWEADVVCDGHDLHLYLAGPREGANARFQHAAAVCGSIDLAVAREFAAQHLLNIHNDNWNDDDVSLDADRFASSLVPRSISVGLHRAVTIYFDDGGLFAGHSIDVQLDDHLQPRDCGISG